MRSLGFGLERIGLLVLKAPWVFAPVLLGVFLAGAFTLPSTHFDGRLIDILTENEAFRDYLDVKERFRDASHDAFLIVESPELYSAEGMEALRYFHIDLSLLDSVETVFSVFSLGEIDSDQRYRPLMPLNFANDEEVIEVVVRLRAEEPAARAMVAPEASIAIVVVTIKAPVNSDNREMVALFDDLVQSIAEITPPGFVVDMAGMLAIRSTVADSLQDDQLRMALAGLLIGIIVGIIVFRSVVAALICAAPAVVAVVVLIGLLNVLGVEIDYLLAILPSLALILALVDSVVFYFHWQSANADNEDLLLNLKQSVLRIGPASAMTSITTALAFASLAFAQNPALQTLAWFGVASVAIAFLAFITALPLLCLALARSAHHRRRRPSFVKIGGPVGRLSLRAPGSRVAVALLAATGLGVVHFNVGSGFDLERLMPDAALAESEVAFGELFGGTVPLYGVVQVPVGRAFYDRESLERLDAVASIFNDVVGDRATVSLLSFWDPIGSDNGVAVADALADSDPPWLSRVLSHDQQSLLVTAYLPPVMPGEEIESLITTIGQCLDDSGLADVVTVTGFPVLTAVEIPDLVDELRLGLMFAIGLAVTVLALASGSLGLALASLIPNLLPILSVEAMLWMLGYDHDLASVVALTIAFGIGIDNAVHIINMYRVNLANSVRPPEALAGAVIVVGPALAASAAILGFSFLATQVSAMPSIGLLGQLIIATLAVALVANIVFLPSFISLFHRARTVAGLDHPTRM